MLKGLIDSNCAENSVKHLCDSLLTENADLLRQVQSLQKGKEHSEQRYLDLDRQKDALKMKYTE